jgi:hypothetical protein
VAGHRRPRIRGDRAIDYAGVTGFVYAGGVFMLVN